MNTPREAPDGFAPTPRDEFETFGDFVEFAVCVDQRQTVCGDTLPEFIRDLQGTPEGVTRLSDRQPGGGEFGGALFQVDRQRLPVSGELLFEVQVR